MKNINYALPNTRNFTPQADTDNMRLIVVRNKSRASWLSVTDEDVDDLFILMMTKLMLMIVFMMMLQLLMMMMMMLMMMMIRGMRVRCWLKLGGIQTRNPPGRHSFLGRLKIIGVRIKI